MTTESVEEEARRFRDWQAAQTHRANYIAELSVLRSRPHELELAALASCRSFALEGLKSCYLLNGGGALAVTAIKGAFPAVVSNTSIATAVGCFLFGLLMAIATNIAGYFAENKRAHEMNNEVAYINAAVGVAFHQTDRAKDDPDAHWNRSVKQSAEADKKVWFSISLAIVSILAFSAGSITLLWAPLFS